MGGKGTLAREGSRNKELKTGTALSGWYGGNGRPARASDNETDIGGNKICSEANKGPAETQSETTKTFPVEGPRYKEAAAIADSSKNVERSIST